MRRSVLGSTLAPRHRTTRSVVFLASRGDNSSNAVAGCIAGKAAALLGAERLLALSKSRARVLTSFCAVIASLSLNRTRKRVSHQTRTGYSSHPSPTQKQISTLRA